MLVQPQTSSSSPADPSPAAAARPRSFESARPCDDPSLASATTSTPASSSARHPQPQSFSHPSDRPQKPSQHSPAPPHSATAAPDSDEKERSPTPNEKAGSTTDVEEEDRSLSSNGKATDVEKSNNALKPPDDGLPAQDTSWQAWLVVFGCASRRFRIRLLRADYPSQASCRSSRPSELRMVSACSFPITLSLILRLRRPSSA